MESTNSRQAAFVVNRKAVESTNEIQNITIGLKLTKIMKSIMPLIRMLLAVWIQPTVMSLLQCRGNGKVSAINVPVSVYAYT